MDARLVRWLGLLSWLVSLGASHRTANFVVEAPSPAIARQVGEQAEVFRRDQAIEWLGKTMPNWSQPCPISVQIGAHLGAGGATSFMFNQGEVYGWKMEIQGPLDRVLDSVLPHEVTHTVFASHFRRPLPRWADEGACTTVEHASERGKQQQLLVRFLQSGRGIPFSQMFAMREYPRDILPLYAQGHSLASFLIHQGGKRKYIAYLEAALAADEWIATTQKFYGFNDLGQLQQAWLAWVQRGSPAIAAPPVEAQLAQNSTPPTPIVYRGQSADPPRENKPVQAIAAGPLVPVGVAAATTASTSGWRAVGKSQAPAASASPRVLLEWSKDTAPPVAPTPSEGRSVYDTRLSTGTLLR